MDAFIDKRDPAGHGSNRGAKSTARDRHIERLGPQGVAGAGDPRRSRWPPDQRDSHAPGVDGPEQVSCDVRGHPISSLMSGR